MFRIMRNTTDYGTLDLVERFAIGLRNVAPLGTLTFVDTAAAQPDDERWDVVIQWDVGPASLRLGIDVKVRSVRSAPAHHPGSIGPATIPVLVSPFIAPPARRELDRRGWSYWDATGNMSLTSESPFVAIRTEGATKDPDMQPSPLAGLRSLKGRAASEVIVGLLRSDGRAVTLRDFAKEHQLPLGTVSRVVSLLREENLIRPTGSGPILVTDPLDIARRWTDDYSFVKSFRARRYRSLSGPQLGLSRVAESGVPYAITGIRAAQNWLEGTNMPNAFPATDTWLYVSDLETVERAADLAQDSRGGQLVIAECDFLDREGRRQVGEYSYVTPWRIAGDLMSAAGRVASVGERVAASLVESERAE